MRFIASPRPTVTVVFPSPAGVGFVFVFFEQRQRKLRFVFAVKFKLVGTDAELFGNVGYRLNVGLFCYFDIS